MSKIKPKKLNFSLDLNDNQAKKRSQKTRKSSLAFNYPFSKEGMNKMAK